MKKKTRKVSKKKKIGRPPKFGTNGSVVVSVRLPPGHVEYLERIGDGKAGEGIIKLINERM